jgi:hypothetical protein
MVACDEASETMSLCPVCREDVSNNPDPNCKTCGGAGLVSGATYIEWQSDTRQRTAEKK